MKKLIYEFEMNKINLLHMFHAVFFILLMVGWQEASAEGSGNPSAGSHTLNGVVRDAYSKKPLNAVQIKTLNAENSAVSNEEGQFSIKLNSAEGVLVAVAYDYNIRQLAVRGNDSIVIDLYPDNFSNYYLLVEGIKGSADNLTSPFSLKSVTGSNQSGAITADNIIQETMGGDLRAINRSGVAGMGASLFVRGINTLNINAQPLFVVDGVIWNNQSGQTSIHQGYIANPLDIIDVNDIENITLLKDGVSIYGSKAANGVILIKTKRGSNTVTKIDLNIVTSISTQPKSIPVMDATQYRTYVSELIKTAGLSNEEIDQLPYLNDNQARSTYLTYHNNTDWSNQVYQTGFSKSYSINVNGGDEKALYYLTLGYTSNTGVVKSTDMERYNIRLNADIKMTEKAGLGLNVGFSRIDRNMIDDGVNSYSSPTWISLIKSPLLSPYNYTSLGSKTSEYTYYDIFNVGNPGGIIENSNNTMKKNSFNITLKPTYQLSPELLISEQFDYSINKTNEDYYRPYLYAAPITIEGIGESENARMSQVIRNNSIFSDTRLSYSHKFNTFHALNVILGSRFIFNSLESDYVEGHNSLSNSSVNLPGSFKNLKTDGVNDLTKSLSHYVNVDYSFNNKYFLNTAMSIDGSSRFGRETQDGFHMFGHSWGVFPSINGAWLLSSESFMKNAKAINLLKLRAGFGLTGNDDIPNYQNDVYFTSIRFRDVANGAVLVNLANPEIQWETTRKANLGIDMSVLNDRLLFNVDIYSSLTKNLLTKRQYQDVAGLNYYWSNGGELSNNGVELSVNAKILNINKFGWEFGVSAGHYVNKITSLPDDLYNSLSALGVNGYTTDVYDGEVLTAVGQPAGVFYGYKTQGVFSTREEAEAADLKIQNSDGTYSTFGAGDMIFEDVADANGVKDGIINANDKQIIGNPNPDLYGTITNKFNYKKLTLKTLFTYSYGNDVYNYQRSQLEAGKDYSNQSTRLNNRWTSEGQITSQPKAVYGDPMGNGRFSDRWIEDGSYIRLKTLSLSYDIPFSSKFLDHLNIWVSANNLFTLTNYLGADPEFSSENGILYQGVDAGLLAQSRSFSFGLKFGL